MDVLKVKSWQSMLRRRSTLNILRVNTLLETSKTIELGDGKNDIVRAAVVLLHATVEDVLRTCQIRRLLSLENDDALNDIAIERDKDDKPIKVYHLGQLRRVGEKAIDDLIKDAVTDHFDRRSYSDADDLEKAARNIGVEDKKASRLAVALKELMRRRHDIVHQSDRDPLGEDTKGDLRKIAPEQIEPWIDAAQDFIAAVLEKADKIKARGCSD